MCPCMYACMHGWCSLVSGPCSQFLVWYGVWPEVLLPQVTGEYDPTQSEEAQQPQLAIVQVDQRQEVLEHTVYRPHWISVKLDYCCFNLWCSVCKMYGCVWVYLWWIDEHLQISVNLCMAIYCVIPKVHTGNVILNKRSLHEERSTQRVYI